MDNTEVNCPFRRTNAMDIQPGSHIVEALRSVQVPTPIGRQALVRVETSQPELGNLIGHRGSGVGWGAVLYACG